MSTRTAPGRCAVEERLTDEQVIELNLLLADPRRWPRHIFEGWKVAEGSVPATMKSWGAVQLGIAWCEERGIPMAKRQMQNHYERHVPILPDTPDDFAVRGAAADSPGASRAVVPTTPMTYLDVYTKGLTVGGRALDLLLEKIERMVANNETPPTDLLLQVTRLGVQLATSQAGILAKGIDMNREKEEEIAGFRAGAGPEPSPRFGDHRVRVIEGEARPVVDRGRADRREYNEKAAEDGSPILPA